MLNFRMLSSVLQQVLAFRTGRVLPPACVTYIATWRCNSRCGMCDLWQRPADATAELSPAAAADIFRQMAPLGLLRVTGGEPSVREDFAALLQAITAAARPEILFLSTNGLLTERIVAAVAPLRVPRLQVKISVDGLGATYTRLRGVADGDRRAEETVRALLALRKPGLTVGINTLIRRDNRGELAAISDRFRRAGAEVEYDFPYAHSGYGLYTDRPNSRYAPEPCEELTAGEREEICAAGAAAAEAVGDLPTRLLGRAFWSGLRRFLQDGDEPPYPSCVALRAHLRLLPDGTVPLCVYKDREIGNLKTQPFAAFWHSPAVIAARQETASCAGCWVGCELKPNLIYSGELVNYLWRK